MNQSRANTNSIGADFGVLGCFLVFGALSGLLLAFLVTRPSLQSFFFIKADKFLIARYSYWCSLSLIQLLGLSGAYALCVAGRLLVQGISQVRLLSAALVIALATPLLYLLTPLINALIGLNFVVAPLAYLLLLSCALCLFSGNLKLLPVALVWILLFTAAGFGFVYIGVRIDERNEIYEFIQWPVLYAMWALAFGNWFIWRQRQNLKQSVR
jgi:hypothetical protein